jgi:hypothetical protein
VCNPCPYCDDSFGASDSLINICNRLEITLRIGADDQLIIGGANIPSSLRIWLQQYKSEVIWTLRNVMPQAA